MSFDLLTALAKRTASDSKFSDCQHLPDIGEQPDDQAVLQYAMGCERAVLESKDAVSTLGETAFFRP